jgi:hypothetical protein
METLRPKNYRGGPKSTECLQHRGKACHVPLLHDYREVDSPQHAIDKGELSGIKMNKDTIGWCVGEVIQED